MKTILVTGGCGFIGSNLIIEWLKHHPDTKIINIDALTYAADLKKLKDIENHPNYTFVKGDIRDFDLIESLFETHQFDGVVHLAAESHVDNSIKKPSVFIETNINGTFNLLECAKRTWHDGPFIVKDTHKSSRFLHVSTDEVYGSLGADGLFTETTAYAPNSPYSASKASSDFLVRSYHKTFGLNTIITNCSNNYGPRQHNEKLIPTIIRNALNLRPLPIYGDGKNIRDWLYVTDHCQGIDLAFHNGQSGETYNIGGRNEFTNLEIVHTICNLLDQKVPYTHPYSELISFVEDRAGHDRRYAIDATKIETTLHWKAEETFITGIEKTVDWYIAHYQESNEIHDAINVVNLKQS